MGKLFDFSSPTPRPLQTTNSTSVTPAPAPVMPDTASPLVAEAERNKRAAILARGGRASTILSDAAESADTPSYASKKLG